MTDDQTIAYAYAVEVVVLDKELTAEQFGETFDATLGRHVEARYPELIPAHILEMLKEVDAEFKPKKGIVTKAGNKVSGGYIVTHTDTVKNIVESVREDIAASGFTNDLSLIHIYTVKDANPTHNFVMQRGEGGFTEVSTEKGNTIYSKYHGYTS